MPTTTRAATVAAALVFGGCGDIVHPVAQAGLDDRIMLTAVLDADAARHAVVASPAEDHVDSQIREVRVTLYRHGRGGWAAVATAEPVEVDKRDFDDEDTRLCYRAAVVRHIETWLHETHLSEHCMIFDAEIEPGETYRVEVSAEGRPTASGTTRVPGDFGVQAAELSTGGDSPVLSFSWTPSPFVHRYLAGISRWEDECHDCTKAWFVDLDSTSYSGPVPQEAVDSAGPHPEVVVAAMDRHLHGFLTSGHGWELFAVQPAMNVENGLGFVGSVAFRRFPVTVRAGAADR